MSNLEQQMRGSLASSVHRREYGSAAALFHIDRAKTMAGPPSTVGEPPRSIYHHIATVRLDQDPTALVMVVPFAFANKVRS